MIVEEVHDWRARDGVTRIGKTLIHVFTVWYVSNRASIDDHQPTLQSRPTFWCGQRAASEMTYG